jgi:hypothetical protein
MVDEGSQILMALQEIAMNTRARQYDPPGDGSVFALEIGQRSKDGRPV